MTRPGSLEGKLQEARAYAQQARDRNKPPCLCPACLYATNLEAVINITKGWVKI